jgi:hypothetical protein
MIKNNKGEYEIEGSALDIICEYEELTVQIKELFKDDKDLVELFERDLLLLFLAEGEDDFLSRPILRNKDKVRLLKKVAKYIKEEKEEIEEEETEDDI